MNFSQPFRLEFRHVYDFYPFFLYFNYFTPVETEVYRMLHIVDVHVCMANHFFTKKDSRVWHTLFR